MREFVYVIRWSTEISGEADCGTFDACYRDEGKAVERMKEDAETTASEMGVEVEYGHGDELDDYAEIDDGGDVFKWWIDKIEIL